MPLLVRSMYSTMMFWCAIANGINIKFPSAMDDDSYSLPRPLPTGLPNRVTPVGNTSVRTNLTSAARIPSFALLLLAMVRAAMYITKLRDYAPSQITIKRSSSVFRPSSRCDRHFKVSCAKQIVVVKAQCLQQHIEHCLILDYLITGQNEALINRPKSAWFQQTNCQAS